MSNGYPVSMAGLRAQWQKEAETWRISHGHDMSEHVTDAWLHRLTGNQPRDILFMFHHGTRWAQFGFPTFELTAGLSSALLLTDLKGQKGLHAPYPSMMVALPSPSPISFLTDDGSEVSAKWILLHRCKALIEPCPKHTRLLDARKLPSKQWCFVSALSAEGLSIWKDCAWPEDADAMEKWLTEAPGGIAKECDNPTDRRALLAVFRLVANLCQYIASLPSVTKESAGKGKDKEPNSADNPLRFVLGREIKLPASMHKAAASVCGDSKGYRLHSRFVVRGHFKQQAYGPAHTMRRSKWIEPYWKGPCTADGLARLYAVDNTKPAPEVT